MKLIVGLGNPGEEYKNTRHNIGFHYLDLIAKSLNITNFKEKFNGLYARDKYMGEDVILLKPLSYMNLSGEVVIKFKEYFKIKPEDIFVIHDDLDMPVGRIKLKENGSSGGHNGIKNIILNLNTEKFKRLKIGISKDKNIETKEYVLGKFQKDELERLDNINYLIDSLIADYFKLSFSDLMAKYNRRDLNETVK